VTDFARVAERPLTIVEELLRFPDGRPFGTVMADFQRRDFAALFAPDSPPNRWVSRVRGASKTADTAAVAIADLLLAPDGSTSFAIAVDQDQARLLRDAVERWYRDSPDLHGSLDFQRDLVVNAATGASLRVLASDAPSALGLLPWRVYADEVAVWPNERMWSSVVSAMHKVPGARLTIMSTAGNPTSWAYGLWRHASESEMWVVLETNELPPWIDSDQVEDARRHLLPSVFARYFENRWTVADDGLLTEEDVDGCTGSIDPSRREQGDRFCIGLDFASVKDRSAIAVVRVGRDDEPHELVAMWTAGGSRNRRVQPSVVDEKLRELHERFSPSTGLADPFQMLGVLEHRPFMRKFDFTGPSKVRLTTLLLEAFREGKVRIPDDAELRRELLGLVVKETSRGFRFENPPGGHDDRVVALCLALVAAEKARGRTSRASLSGLAAANGGMSGASSFADGGSVSSGGWRSFEGGQGVLIRGPGDPHGSQWERRR